MRTAAASSESSPYSAAATCAVASANRAKSAVRGSEPPVTVRYQMRPARSQAWPPSATATRWNALFGMPELMCTPPLSSVVST